MQFFLVFYFHQKNQLGGTIKGKDVVLGLLHKQDRSGYELKEVIETRLSHFFGGTFGMIYPLLKKLEKEKLIEKTIIIQEGKPNKNIYKITDEGIEHFNQYLKSELEKDVYKSDFLMRLYFAEYMDSVDLESLIKDEISNKKAQIKQLEVEHSNWKQGWTEYQKLTYEIGIEQYKLSVDILEKFLKKSKS